MVKSARCKGSYAAFTVVSSAVEAVVKIDRIDRAFVITTSEFGGGDAILGSRFLGNLIIQKCHDISRQNFFRLEPTTNL